MFYVYIIKSIHHPEKIYVGYSTDINARLDAHNQGKSTFTATYRPWKLETYLAFSSQAAAKDFETYLKSGSGRALLHKRLVQSNLSL